jgi:hypothetical protein
MLIATIIRIVMRLLRSNQNSSGGPVRDRPRS